jgi:hypothetical protein
MENPTGPTLRDSQPQAPVLLAPAAVGLLRHPDLTAGLLGALALGQLDFDRTQLADDLFGRVPLASHLPAPFLKSPAQTIP